MYWAFRVMTVGLLLALALSGCPCGRQKSSYYRDWSRDNATAVQDLRNLAADKNWKIVASSGNGVSVLDLGKAEYQPIYSTKNRVRLASSVEHGRVAVIESAGRGWTKHFLVIVDIGSEKEIPRVEIDDKPGSLLPLPKAVLLRENDVLFPVGGRLDRYDTATQQQGIVLEGRALWNVEGVQELGSYLYVTREHYLGGDPELLVLDEDRDYALKARYEGVRNAVFVGGNAFVEREGKIYEFDPDEGVGQLVTDGVLLGSLGDKGFMYSDALDPGQSGSLFVHYLQTGESRKLTEFEHLGVPNLSMDPFVSPQADYVFVCRKGKAVYPGTSREYYWEVYEAESGRLVGAFYNPYLGKWYLSFLLGWSE